MRDRTLNLIEALVLLYTLFTASGAARKTWRTPRTDCEDLCEDIDADSSSGPAVVHTSAAANPVAVSLYDMPAHTVWSTKVCTVVLARTDMRLGVAYMPFLRLCAPTQPVPSDWY